MAELPARPRGTARGRLAALAALAGLLAAASLPAQPIRVRGRVALTPGSTPAAGVRAELFPVVDPYASALRRLATGAEDVPAATALAGPGGAFEIAAPAADYYRVVVRAEGYVAAERLLSPLAEPEVLPPARLLPASPLRVEALGPDGLPIPGIDLYAYTESLEDAGHLLGWQPMMRHATTGPDGTAVLPRGRGEGLAILVTSPRFLGHSIEKIAAARATLRLAVNRTVRLQIRDARGQPAARALARLGADPWVPLGIADAAGRLDLAVFPGRPLPVLVEDSAGGLAELSLPTKADPAAVLYVELRPPEVLAGRVLDARTRGPLPGAVVRSEAYPSGPGVRAGAGGVFRLPVRRSPRLVVLAGAAGYVPVRTELDRAGTASAAATLLLEPAAEIAGMVVDGQGNPVARARIQARPTRWDLSPDGLTDVSTGRDGRFRLPHLVAGVTYRLQATREGFAPGSALAESARPGKGIPVRILLVAGRTAAGRVAGPGGRPVAGAALTLFRSADFWDPAAGEQRSWRATSDGAGAFALRDLPPGPYRLHARAAGFAPATRALPAPMPRGAAGGKASSRVVIWSAPRAPTRSRPAPASGCGRGRTGWS